MARTRSRLDYKNQAGEVAERFRKEKETWKKERLQVIKLLLETTQSYKDVAQIVGRSPSSVKEWARQFRLGGIERLLVRGNGGGRKGKMQAQAQEALVEKLKIGAFRTAGQIQKWLTEEYGIEYAEGSLYYQLGKLGGRLKVARPCHEKKDKQASEDFKVTLADKMKELQLPKNQGIKLWVYDKMRYGLHLLMRRVWSLRGVRVIAPVFRKFQWGYLF